MIRCVLLQRYDNRMKIPKRTSLSYPPIETNTRQLVIFNFLRVASQQISSTKRLIPTTNHPNISLT